MRDHDRGLRHGKASRPSPGVPAESKAREPPHRERIEANRAERAQHVHVRTDPRRREIGGILLPRLQWPKEATSEQSLGMMQVRSCVSEKRCKATMRLVGSH